MNFGALGAPAGGRPSVSPLSHSSRRAAFRLDLPIALKSLRLTRHHIHQHPLSAPRSGPKRSPSKGQVEAVTGEKLNFDKAGI